MCAIVGSSNTDKLWELIQLNSTRGSHSYSLSCFRNIGDPVHGEVRGVVLERALGTINRDTLEKCSGDYTLVHIQAPTTENQSAENIHPATIPGKGRLWHNGVLKADMVDKLRKKHKRDTFWDTELLLHEIEKCGFDSLNDVDGGFSCVYLSMDEKFNTSHRLFIFRNSICPLFIDKDMNISSMKFDGSYQVEVDTVFKMNLSMKQLELIQKFKTYDNPYYFGD